MVLDIGPGHGTYSKLMRKRNQIWHCLEIHEPYVERFRLRRFYDEIFIGDMLSFPIYQTYNVIILGDVLEHVTNDEGVKVLKRLLKHTDLLVVSLPIDKETNAPLGDLDRYWNNPYELHKGLWTNKLFISTIISLNAEIIFIEKFREIAIYIIARHSNEHIDTEIVNNYISLLHYKYGNKYSNFIDERPCWKRINVINYIFSKINNILSKK